MSKKTAELFYSTAKSQYIEAAELVAAKQYSDRQSALEGAAAKDFLVALVLGHLEAPYSLFVCFEHGVGVKKDDYIAKLMFGAALQLKDPKCERAKDIVVPPDMKEQVTSLTKLIKETYKKMPKADTGHDMEVVNSQFGVFSAAIKLPDGKDIIYCFISEDKEDSNSDDLTEVYESNNSAEVSNSVPLSGEDTHHHHHHKCDIL